MAYTPVPIIDGSIDDKVYQNIFALVDEYALPNTSINIQDNQLEASFPSYTIFIPDVPKVSQDFQSTNLNKSFTVQIDFDVTAKTGWRQTALMYDALEAGIKAEKDNLKTAMIAYKGSTPLAREPIDVNGQQILSRSDSFSFDILY